MPELPEVETIRRRLADTIVGRTVKSAILRRRDVLRYPCGDRKRGQRHGRWLLRGKHIAGVSRRGKQLHIADDSGLGLLVCLGMSGRVALSGDPEIPKNHRHITWCLESESSPSLRMHFIDPRRFGGVYAVTSLEDLEKRFWYRMGPDALTVTHQELKHKTSRTQRNLKGVLLDQSVIAGVGNIYADESLHKARLAPQRAANSLDDTELRRLAGSIRSCLRAACDMGGTTFRDYRNADGGKGEFVTKLQVYGRQGSRCLTCKTTLRCERLVQRSTVWCPRCQPNSE